jgi:hypothetical protein
MKLLIMKFSQLSCYIVPLRPKYSPQHRSNIQKFYIVLAFFEWFVRFSERTATFALYIINWLVFITVVESVSV